MSQAAFTPESLDFLITNKMNNSRTWYQEHKTDYNQLILAPFQALVEALSETMLSIDSGFEVRPMVDKTISRIYRDTRFAKDKSLYRDCMWLSFKHAEKKNVNYPGYFCEINPFEYRYGMGFFSASPATMVQFRNRIDKKTNEFLALIQDLEQKGNFQPEGELYKRSLYKGPHEELRTWYDRKNIYLTRNCDDIDDIFDLSGLADTLKEHFLELAPLYQFFCSSL